MAVITSLEDPEEALPAPDSTGDDEAGLTG
jgi:hypothetical protein